MNSRFVYTEDDAKGCNIQSPDFTECKDCLFNCVETPIKCLIYKNMKPSTVIYDKKLCEKKRIKIEKLRSNNLI